ncbi:MAG: cupin domain-containing protein [Phycisphaerales bacterium]
MDQPRSVSIVRAGDGLGEAHAGGTRAAITLGNDQSGGSHGVIVGDTPVGGGPPFHVHHTFDETFFILEGRFTYFTEDAAIEAGPGDMLFVPGEVPHGFRCTQGGERGVGRTAMVVTPGRFLGFFEAMERLAEAGELNPQKLGDLGEAWGVKFLEAPEAMSPTRSS